MPAITGRRVRLSLPRRWVLDLMHVSRHVPVITVERRIDLSDVIAASTQNAALALRRPELGSLKAGCVGDATILKIKKGRFDYVDVVGEHMEADRKIAAEGVVVAGRWWHPKAA
jgi:predicted amidohydrolase